MSPNLQSKADYLSFDTSAITYSDRVCNLGDPNDHTTSATAFEISTSEQLWEITDCVSNSATVYFELGDDIDVSDASKSGTAPTNSPIGFSTSGDISFSGVIDGGNKVVSGISMSTTSYGVGLFAYLHSATISNLVISGSFVTTTTGTSDQHSAGGLAIRADGSLDLSSISNQAGVTGKNNVGGLLGYVELDANINSSYNTGPVLGSAVVGGLVGFVNANANINSSSNTGPVSGSTYVGGLVGFVNANANINSSYNTGTVSGTTYLVGGLVGYVLANANITSSYNTGTVSGSQQVGGLVGRALDANINFSYNTGTVSGTIDLVGGLVGYVLANANINSSYNTGAVSGSDYLGGLVGYVSGNANITSSYNEGAVFGAINSSGGLVGYVFANANINSSYNTGDVSGSNVVGGLVGKVNSNANIASSYNAGTVSGTTDVDGLAGTVSGTVTTTAAYTSVTSDHVATSTVADMKLASTYVGFNFTNSPETWGFGSCTDNQGFPMLRVFAQISNYNSVACADNSPPPQSSPSPGSTPAPTPTPAPVYSGPIISETVSVVAGVEVTLTGNRLEGVTTAHVGGVQVRIVSALSQSLTLDIPSSMVPGSYDLVLQSSFGTLTIQNGLRVLAPLDTGLVVEAANKKLTVVALKGFIAIYTKGYEGQRLSVKVAGKWLVVPEISENWKGNNYSRTIRFTGASKSVKVHLYIDRKFVRTEELLTR